jgi:hypothetical protein
MMNSEEYQQWASDPLTVKFHQFLRDYRQGLMETWATGNYVSDTHNAQQIGRAMMLMALCDLADDAISEFYRQPPKVEKEGDDVSGNQEAGR